MPKQNENNKKIISTLDTLYDNEGTFLNYSTPYELFIAVILSAQCTDKRVNEVTKHLFKTANTPEQILNLGCERLKSLIKSCGLYKTKAKNIIAATKIICEKYDGKIPNNFDDLISLPGVGRKTANVLLANIYKQDAIAVDTHVYRVANRTGLATGKNAETVEESLKRVIDKSMWSDMHCKLIMHGRTVCTARNPKCQSCAINTCCRHFNNKV